MSALSVWLNSSLSTVGFAANHGRPSATRRGEGDPARSEQAGDEKAVQKGNPSSPSARPELTPAERRRVAELKRIDAEVRAHEQAHITVGRELITSGARYEYTYGPDGKQYAIAGEVGIDTSPEDTPHENIEKGLHIQATALAPIDPSPQDYSVAAAGKSLEQRGRADLREEQREAAERSRDARLQAYGAPRAGPNSRLDVYA